MRLMNDPLAIEFMSRVSARTSIGCATTDDAATSVAPRTATSAVSVLA
jgi:hypothetical protein